MASVNYFFTDGQSDALDQAYLHVTSFIHHTVMINYLFCPIEFIHPKFSSWRIIPIILPGFVLDDI